jgi:HK97 family phage prohead protease
MKLTMPVAVTAADSDSRTISGTIVTWNEQGRTSAGLTKFAKNSIALKSVKLFLEHDRTKPIGKVLSYDETEEGIEAVFKIGKTSAGSDALVEAAEGLRDGFSVGIMVDEYEIKDGVMVITASTLDEVSLVESPAIDSARVSEVAASDDPNTEKEGSDMTDTPEVAADTEVSVEAAEVKAAAPVAQPLTYTRPRSPIVDKATYLEHSVRAKLGNEDSRQFVAFADDTTSNNSGLIPTRQLTEVINPLSNADRPMIEAISRGALPDAGMTFEIPKITVVPTVADVNEAQPITETGMETSFLSVSVNKYAGGQTFSVELLDRSNPVFFTELVRQMEFAYAKATDDFVGDEIANNGTLNATATTEDKDGLLTFVSSAAAAVYGASLGFARNLVVSPQQWARIMSYNDSGRPIYTASQPQNAGGAVAPTSIRGNVLGLDLYVDRNFGGTGGTGLGDYSMVVVNPDAYTWYESPRVRLQTNVALNGQIEVSYYGYGALATKIAAGANWFNKS